MQGGEKVRREYSIDIFKGLLVIGMILVHIMQFFSDVKISPSIEYVINYGNLITFSGFVFCFGYAVQLAYLEKDFGAIWKKLLKNVIKTLCAFYVSGIAFKLFIGNSAISWRTFVDVLLLNDMPGWSEFLASFAYFNLVTLILFVPFKKLLNNKVVFWIIFALLFLTCLIPYERVTVNQIGVLIGTKNFACFPVLQYMPYYLLGMYFKKYNINFNISLLIGSSVLTAIPVIKYIVTNSLPGRFPPTIGWILMPMFILYLYYLLSKYLERYQYLVSPVIIFGQNVLFSLVMSNLLIFTLKSKFDSFYITSIQCLYMEAIFLIIIYSLISFIGKTKRLRNKENAHEIVA
jgi:hypothetical protein